VRCFELASDYAQNQVRGGRILVKHQSVALRLADMATKLLVVRAIVERAAAAVDPKAPYLRFRGVPPRALPGDLSENQ
jgi:alkylation response protein AidB-like acyl-CoA dehydrogenase